MPGWLIAMAPYWPLYLYFAASTVFVYCVPKSNGLENIPYTIVMMAAALLNVTGWSLVDKRKLLSLPHMGITDAVTFASLTLVIGWLFSNQQLRPDHLVAMAVAISAVLYIKLS